MVIKLAHVKIYLYVCGMKKTDTLDRIKDSFNKEANNEARNSMGTSESFYNVYYLVGMCFTDDEKIKLVDSELNKMTENELNNLIKLAKYASDAFY